MPAQNPSQTVKSVNSQSTDAITQANMMTLGLAPAQSVGTLYQTSAQAAGASMQNAVANQQNMYTLALAPATPNLQSLLALSSAAAGRTTASLLSQRQVPIAPIAFYRPHPAATVPPAEPPVAAAPASVPPNGPART